MASFVYNNAMLKIANGEINLDTNDLRVALVKTNTTCDTEEEVTLMNGFSILGEVDSTGYSRSGAQNISTSINSASDLVEVDHDSGSTTFSSVSQDDYMIEGAVLYKHVSSDGANIPIAFIDFTTNFHANGGDITINWNTNGIIRIQRG